MPSSSIFLSHTHLDKPFARRIAEDLTNEGVHVWIDEAEINIGDSLIEKIREGIDSVDYLVVVLSPNSVESEWVKREVDIAMNQEIEGKRVKVLPLLYRQCALPWFLKGKLYVDFTDINRYTDGLKLILRRLGLRKENTRKFRATKNLDLPETIHIPPGKYSIRDNDGPKYKLLSPYRSNFREPGNTFHKELNYPFEISHPLTFAQYYIYCLDTRNELIGQLGIPKTLNFDSDYNVKHILNMMTGGLQYFYSKLKNDIFLYKYPNILTGKKFGVEVAEVDPDKIVFNLSEPTAKELSDRYSWLSKPVVNLTWYEANNFCAWLSRKTGLSISLPSEVQCLRALMYFSEHTNIYSINDIYGRLWYWTSDWYSSVPSKLSESHLLTSKKSPFELNSKVLKSVHSKILDRGVMGGHVRARNFGTVFIIR